MQPTNMNTPNSPRTDESQRRRYEAGIPRGSANRRFAKRAWQNVFLFSRRLGISPFIIRRTHQLLNQLTRSHAIQRRFFQQDVRYIRDFLVDGELPFANPDAVTAQIIANHMLVRSLNQLTDRDMEWNPVLTEREFSALVQVKGASFFNKTRHSRNENTRPVVLVSNHFTFVSALPIYLDSLDLPDLTIVGFGGHRRLREWERTAKQTVDEQALMYLRHLKEAQNTLKQKGVILILADGPRGISGVSVPFFNRNRLFLSTFAEMALDADAAVVPVAVIISPPGRLTIQFADVFTCLDDTTSRNERITHLVEQYVAWLHARWLEAPSNITVQTMRKHLYHPLLAEKESA